MAKFCLSGRLRDGTFYFVKQWYGIKCLCGQDFNGFMDQLAYFHNLRKQWPDPDYRAIAERLQRKNQ